MKILYKHYKHKKYYKNKVLSDVLCVMDFIQNWSKKCTDLILCGDNKEVICRVSDYQIKKVKKQGKLVLKALEIAENVFVNEGNIT